MSLLVSNKLTSAAPNRQLHEVVVKEIRLISPNMKRITVGGAIIRSYPPLVPGQWVKLFVPDNTSSGSGGRAYTIRYLNQNDDEMDIDFVLHGDGPCSTWASGAAVGDVIEIAGPRSGFSIPEDLEFLLIGGDETALPAIGAILEELPASVKAIANIEVPIASDIQQFVSRAKIDVNWIVREGCINSTLVQTLQERMMTCELPIKNYHIWFAGESEVVRNLRRFYVQDKGLEKSKLSLSGYWKRGEIDYRDNEKI